MDLEGKRLLLSGATGGIGRAIAEQLAGQGARLVLSSRKGEELEEPRPVAAGRRATATSVVADLAEPGRPRSWSSDAGDLDGLVANAALPATGKLEKLQLGGGPARPPGQLRVADPDGPRARPEARREGRGPPRLHRLALREGRHRRGRPSTARPSSGCAASPSALREDLHPHGVGVSIVSPGFVREAGMFADAGVKPPPGLGTTTPEKVGRGGRQRDHAQPQRDHGGAAAPRFAGE